MFKEDTLSLKRCRFSFCFQSFLNNSHFKLCLHFEKFQMLTPIESQKFPEESQETLRKNIFCGKLSNSYLWQTCFLPTLLCDWEIQGIWNVDQHRFVKGKLPSKGTFSGRCKIRCPIWWLFIKFKLLFYSSRGFSHSTKW